MLIYELIGPLLTRMSLKKAGEIVSGSSDQKNRERFEKKPAKAVYNKS